MSSFRNLLLAFSDNAAPTRLAVNQFCTNVARRTNGMISISAVPDKQLGHSMTLINTVMSGNVDMLIQPVDRWGGMAQKFGCVSTPFAFDDQAHADRVLGAKFNAWVNPDLESLGLVNLSCWEWGFRQISNSRRRILKPEDLRGLKIRVPPSSIYRLMMVTFGAMPVVVEYEKMASVIKQKLVDGQENPVIVFSTYELHSAQKYLALLNYSYGTNGHLINKSCFDRLTPEQQVVICEESAKAGQLMAGLVRNNEAESLLAMAGQGVQVDWPDPEPFKKLVKPVLDALEAYFGADNQRSFMALLQDQRQPADLKTIAVSGQNNPLPSINTR